MTVTIQTLELEHCSVSYDARDDTLFPTTFAFLDEEHLLVETSDNDGDSWTALVLGDDYEVTGDGDPEPGGAVSTDGLLGSIPEGTTVRITRQTPITQETSFQTSGPLPAKAITAALVKLTMIAQEERAISDALQTGDLVDVTELADGVRVVSDFVTDAAQVEDTFPFDIPVAGGDSAVNAIWRVFPHGDEAHRFDTPPFVQWKPGATVDTITIVAIDGLEVGTNYDIHGLVLF